MKKHNSIKRFLALFLALIMLCAITVTAYASTNTHYSPSSGNNFGTYKNATRTAACRYDNLPNGTIRIDYFLDGTNNMQIRFYTNSNLTGGYYWATLINNNGAAGENGSTTVTIPAGTYYVCLYSSTPKSFSYGFELYK